MQRFVNNFFAQLTGALAAGGAVLPISTEAAAKLPMGAGDHYLLTLVGTLDPSQQTVVEIVKATPGAGGAIAIERAQESTGAGSWPADTWVFCSMTAGTLGGLFSTLAAQSDAIAAQGELIGQQQDAIGDQATLISQLQGDIADQAALINQQQTALQDLQDRVTVLEGGTVPDGRLIDSSGNYLVDDQGNYLKGA
ncbi:hypothetical protein N5J43_17005 [Pseudomonas nicosulfuronedens]|uniref:hypothetical protein n=1 Tax=Pseudomonas nicosulfuronedens TaxID=2571105 RepID=UPI00244CFB89|nr:hypothetical protein [Pseudomonas nicosulfuronedens]MDH1011980.1 hypothetical protein [Pseudomonas nicosulfuronedens]MDH1980652.1 hypothetical protein [Pseudomonas nicosulfuronedens]MDH2027602.1 hypothetical protein [Pseudomonas nicosulfuronedens]